MKLKKLCLYFTIIICHSTVSFASKTPNDNSHPWTRQVSENCLQEWRSNLNQQKLLKLKETIQQEKQDIIKSVALITTTLEVIHSTPLCDQPITLSSQPHAWSHYVDKECLQEWKDHLNLQKLLKLKDNTRRAGRNIEKLETEISDTLKKIQVFCALPSQPTPSVTQDPSPQQVISPTKTHQLLDCLSIKQSGVHSNPNRSSSKTQSVSTKRQLLLDFLKVEPKMATAYVYPESIKEALTSYRNIVDACCKFGIDKSLAQPTVKRALEHKDLESNDVMLTSLTKLLTKEETQELMSGEQKRETVVKFLRAVDPMSSAADFAERFNW